MALDIRKEYYREDEINFIQGVRLFDNNLYDIKSGEFEGRKYRVYQGEQNCEWRVAKAIGALLGTISIIGLILFWSRICDLWKAVWTGKEIKVYKVLTADVNPMIRNTDALGRTTLHPQPPITDIQQDPIKKLKVSPFPNLFEKEITQEEIARLPSVHGFVPSQGSSLDAKVEFLDEKKEIIQPISVFRSLTLNQWLQIGSPMGLLYLYRTAKEEVDKRILDRINFYNEAIQLQDRLCAFKNTPHIEAIQIGDLEDPWAESALKIALLTDQEVGNLTVAEIQGMSERQLDILRLRVPQEAEVPYAGEITEYNFGKITFRDLLTVSGDKVNPLLDFLNLGILQLLTEEQCDELDVLMLSDEQFQYILSNEKRVQNLDAPTLAQCIGRLADLLPRRLSRLTEGQVRSLDFSALGPITSDILYKLVQYDFHDKGRLIRCLTPQQVLLALQRSLFKNSQNELISSYLTADQVKEINFTEIDNLSECAGFDVINAIFTDKGKVKSIQIGSLNHIVRLILPHKLAHLTPQQMNGINYLADDSMSTAILNGMGNSNYWQFEDDLLGRVIRSMDSQKVIDALNKGLFSDQTACHITSEQLKEIDFSEVDLEAAGGMDVINSIFTDKGKVKSIQVGSINRMVRYISPYKLAHLTPEQMNGIYYFVNDSMSTEILNGMGNSNHWQYENDLLGRVIRSMDPQKVVDALNKGLFSDQTACHITSEQLKEIDFSKVDLEAAGGMDVINSIFTDKGKVKSIQVGSLNLIIPYIAPRKLAHLTQEQVNGINFSADDPIKQATLEGMGNSNHWYYEDDLLGRVIRYMNAQQVIAALNRSLFTDISFSISDVQLRQLNLDEIRVPVPAALAGRKRKL